MIILDSLLKSRAYSVPDLTDRSAAKAQIEKLAHGNDLPLSSRMQAVEVVHDQGYKEFKIWSRKTAHAVNDGSYNLVFGLIEAAVKEAQKGVPVIFPIDEVDDTLYIAFPDAPNAEPNQPFQLFELRNGTVEKDSRLPKDVVAVLKAK